MQASIEPEGRGGFRNGTDFRLGLLWLYQSRYLVGPADRVRSRESLFALSAFNYMRCPFRPVHCGLIWGYVSEAHFD